MGMVPAALGGEGPPTGTPENVVEKVGWSNDPKKTPPTSENESTDQTIPKFADLSEMSHNLQVDLSDVQHYF
jgi:hypothetical protein